MPKIRSRAERVEAMLDRLRHAVADEPQDGDLITTLKRNIRALGVGDELREVDSLAWNGDEFVWREAL